MKCPHCGKNLLQHIDGKVKLRSPVLIFSPDGKKCALICPKCSGEVEVPIQLSPGAIEASSRERITLSR